MLRTSGGSENVSSEFGTLHERERIFHAVVLTYTHQQKIGL